jgi:hypothetical protein
VAHDVSKKRVAFVFKVYQAALAPYKHPTTQRHILEGRHPSTQLLKPQNFRNIIFVFIPVDVTA